MYYKYNRRKEIIKNIILISLIIFIAVFSTYHIYNKFNDTETIDYSSDSLDITFHEKNGDELDITKIIPLTDAVGLSSKGHNITIKNNLTEPVNYTIKITDNVDKMLNQNCEGITIPKEEIKISLKDFNGKTEIYNLSELENKILYSATVKPLEENKYTIRIWINNETTLPSGSDNHYHGLIQIFENDLTLAVK